MGKRSRARRRMGAPRPTPPPPGRPLRPTPDRDPLRSAVRDDDRAVLDAAAADRVDHLVATVGSLWDRGWQPTDVVRAASRKVSTAGGRLVAVAVVVDAGSYLTDGRPVHPEWAAQVEAARSSLRGPLPSTWSWSALERLTRASRFDLLGALEETASLLRYLPDLPVLIPPPSGWVDDPAVRLRWAQEQGEVGDLDDKVLTKIRALLAKAESTTFPEEAEALTAKAQELITRHAVDDVLLSAGRRADAPIGRRIPLDDPYAETKSMLLGVVATANRCRAVYMTDLATSTVFGYPSDLRAVDLLFTSLLVQATSAMVAAGEGQTAGSHTRGRGFRRSFLTAYAVRVGERLREASEATEAEADAGSGGALLPVLVSRSEAVDEALAAAFPHTTVRRSRAYDAHGWHAGTSAADRATLGGADRSVPDGARGALPR